MLSDISLLDKHFQRVTCCGAEMWCKTASLSVVLFVYVLFRPFSWNPSRADKSILKTGMHAVLILKTEIFFVNLPSSAAGGKISSRVPVISASLSSQHWLASRQQLQFEGLCQSCRCASRCSSRSRHPLLFPLVKGNVNCEVFSRLLLCAEALCFALQTRDYLFISRSEGMQESSF